MKLLKMILNGIAWGCTICTFVLITGSAAMGDAFLSLSANDFIRHAVGSMIVGIGFTVPSLIYENENLRMGIKTLIHMGIGFIIYFIVALNVHWIPVDFGWGITILAILIALIVGFAIWAGYYLYNKREAKKLNQRLKSMK